MDNKLLLDIVSIGLLAGCWFIVYKQYPLTITLSALSITLGICLGALLIKFREIKK